MKGAAYWKEFRKLMWQWLFHTGDDRNDWYLVLVAKQARPSGIVFLLMMLIADAGVGVGVDVDAAAAVAVAAAVVIVAA